MQNNFIQLFYLCLFFIRYAWGDVIWFIMILDSNFSVASEYLALGEKKNPCLFSSNRKERSLSLHHFEFILPVCEPATAYPNFVHIFEVYCDYLLSLNFHFLSLCLSTCMSSSNLWSSPWGKPDMDTHTFPQLKEISVLLTISHSNIIEISNATEFSNEQSSGKKNK